jgi:hypothetical protein
MTDWKEHYKKRKPIEMKPWHADMEMKGVSVSKADKLNGSPKAGDMVARNPNDPDDKWLVSEGYYEEFYYPSPD